MKMIFIFNTDKKYSMFGTNLVILAQICDQLSPRQVEFPKILSPNGQNDLEGLGQRPICSILTESVPWRMFGANLVIPAQNSDELSCGQSKVCGRTDGQTDSRRQRQYPFGLQGERVKTAHMQQLNSGNENISYACSVHQLHIGIGQTSIYQWLMACWSNTTGDSLSCKQKVNVINNQLRNEPMSWLLKKHLEASKRVWRFRNVSQFVVPHIRGMKFQTICHKLAIIDLIYTCDKSLNRNI